MLPVHAAGATGVGMLTVNLVPVFEKGIHMTMRTFAEMHNDCNKSGWPCAYWGERGTWYVAAGRSRDSELIEESNWHAILEALGGESDTVAIERENHWACGWVEHLLIDPADTARVQLANELRERIENYPILDEEDYSRREDESCNQIWTECYRPSERVEYFREHSYTGTFRELLAAVRGDWYAAASILHCPSDLVCS